MKAKEGVFRTRGHATRQMLLMTTKRYCSEASRINISKENSTILFPGKTMLVLAF